MSKSSAPAMSLNKKQKEAILRGLLVKSIKKHGEPIVAASVAIRDLWRNQYIINAEKAFPFLDKKHWPTLIQAGAANSRSSGVSVRTLDKKTDPKNRDNYTSRNVGQIHIPCHTTDLKEGFDVIEGVVAQAWTGLMYTTSGIDTKSTWSQTYDMSMRLSFPDVLMAKVEDVPLSKFEAGTIEDPELLDWATRAVPLVREAERLSAKIKAILEELFNYYILLRDVLASIRTFGQLEEQFPEALEFCPDKPKRVNQVVATEQLAAARAILKAGIPVG